MNESGILIARKSLFFITSWPWTVLQTGKETVFVKKRKKIPLPDNQLVINTTEIVTSICDNKETRYVNKSNVSVLRHCS